MCRSSFIIHYQNGWQGNPIVPEERHADPLQLVRDNGPWVYELFAVLIHSGSALGGHYFAHIKSLGDEGEKSRADR